MSWDRDKLLMELTKFSFRAKPNMSDEIQRYRAFYDLDMSIEFGELEQRIGWFDTPDFRVVMQTFSVESAKGTVFVFHGYFDHAGIYQHLIRFLLSNGFCVVIYDMPGHGLSSGEPTSITRFTQYQDTMDACLTLCEKNLPKPYHCVGQSTGGAVLIDRMIQEKDGDSSFDKCVLLAPLVRPRGWKSIKRIHSVVSPFLNVWHRSFSQNSDDANFVSFLKDVDPLQSKWLAVDWIGALKDWVPRIESGASLGRKVLIVQGTNDQTVDWQHNLKVLKYLFNEVKITYIEDGRHQLVNESYLKRSSVFKAMLSELTG